MQRLMCLVYTFKSKTLLSGVLLLSVLALVTLSYMTKAHIRIVLFGASHTTVDSDGGADIREIDMSPVVFKTSALHSSRDTATRVGIHSQSHSIPSTKLAGDGKRMFPSAEAGLDDQIHALHIPNVSKWLRSIAHLGWRGLNGQMDDVLSSAEWSNTVPVRDTHGRVHVIGRGSPGYAHDPDNAMPAVSRLHYHTAEQCIAIVASARAIAERPAGRGMDDLGIFLAKVALGLPFGFAHFNDGEIAAARSTKGETDCGQQSLSSELKAGMRRALSLDRHGFYAGLPCAREYGKARIWANGLVQGHRRTQTTSATVWINGNYGLSRRFLIKLLRIHGQPSPLPTGIRIVVSEVADVEMLQRATGLVFNDVMRVPERQAFPAGCVSPGLLYMHCALNCNPDAGLRWILLVE
jgi:hypothetical protein